MRRTIRTVIADDSPDFKVALKSFLATLPRIEIVGEAPDGESALERTTGLAPDLLLLDMMMPRKSGIDVLMRVHRLDTRPKVIMLTLHPAAEYRGMAIGHGADAYVCKADLVSDLPGVIDDLFPVGE